MTDHKQKAINLDYLGGLVEEWEKILVKYVLNEGIFVCWFQGQIASLFKEKDAIQL